MNHFLSKLITGLYGVLLLLSAAVTAAQTPSFDRAVTCAYSPDYGAGPRQVVVDGQGNTIAAGHFNGSVVVGNTLLTSVGTIPGVTDIFVAKLDASGAYAWAAQANGTEWDYVTGIAVDAAGNAGCGASSTLISYFSGCTEAQ